MKEAATKSGAGDYIGAISVWNRVIEQNPSNIEAYMYRAKLRRTLGDNKGAAEDLDQALTLSPDNISCLIERAAVRRRLNEYRKCLEDLNRIVELKPARAETYADRGWAKMSLGDFIGSYSDYHAAVTLDPSMKSKISSLVLPQAGPRVHSDSESSPEEGEHSQQGEHSAATEHLLSSEQKRQLSPAATATPSGESARSQSQTQLARLNNAAVKQINERRFEKAISTLAELISTAPEYAHAKNNLTIAHNNWGLELAKHSPARAAKQFRQALYVDPSQGASRRNLDAMIREMGKNPRDADDRLALAHDCLNQSDFAGAFVEASEAAKIKNTPAVRAVLKKAIACLEQKEAEEATRKLIASAAAGEQEEQDLRNHDDTSREEKSNDEKSHSSTGRDGIGAEAKTDFDKCPVGKSSLDKKPPDKIAPERITSDRITSDRSAPDKDGASDRSATDRSATDKDGADKSSHELGVLDKSSIPTVLGQLKPTVIVPAGREAVAAAGTDSEVSTADMDLKDGDLTPQAVIDQARGMDLTGHTAEAEALLEKLINFIKGRAAVDESAGLETLDQALEALAQMYMRSENYAGAQTNLSELIQLRECARTSSDPILGSTYRQYAKVLGALNRTTEAKLYEDKANAIMDSVMQEAKQ